MYVNELWHDCVKLFGHLHYEKPIHSVNTEEIFNAGSAAKTAAVDYAHENTVCHLLKFFS